MRASAEEVAAELRMEFARSTEEFRSRIVKLTEAMDELRMATDRHMLTERTSREERLAASQDQITELERQLRREIARIASESQASCLQIQDLLSDHRQSVDRQLSTDRMARDEQRGSLQESMDTLEKEMRKELLRQGELQDSSMCIVAVFDEF